MRSFAALVLAQLVLGAPLSEAARPRPATEATLARVGQRSVAVPGGRVREEAGRWEHGGAYIDPNEQPDGFGSALTGIGKHGVVISVGTMRAVHAGVQAVSGLDRIPRGFRLYQLDLDAQTARFNLIHRDVLADARTRATHSARIVRSRSREGRKRTADPRLAQVRANFTGVAHRWPRGVPTFLTDDAAYATAHALAEGGHLVPLAGSIAGHTMTDLARALARSRTPVVAVDISNVLEHLGRDGPGWPESGRAAPSGFVEPASPQLARFVASLREMPRAPGAKLLFSWRGNRMWGPGPIRTDGPIEWAFFSVTLDDVLAAADRGYFATPSGISKFVVAAGRAGESLGDREQRIEARPGFAQLLPPFRWKIQEAE